MKVYHVEGIRHCGVIFADTPEKAILQALDQELVGDWEEPIQAFEIPLPRNCRIICDENIEENR